MSEFFTHLQRFWSFQDPAIRTAAAAVVLLGISCGTLGCFVVLRRLSLMGDSLGHAVLPGVCLGFLVTWTKNPFWIFVGAVGAAIVASWLIAVVQRRTRLKPDVAMGLVLSGFFGLGVMLLTRLQNFSAGNQSGLNTFLFGQASAIGERDLWLIGTLAGVILATVGLFFKELALSSFDEGFAAALGMNVRLIHYLLMLLIALAIVISIQAVGVVLLSALLITPAATALLLTDRLKVMVVLSSCFAVFAGIVGLNASLIEQNLPTGPAIVVVLAVLFLAAYLFAPRYGVVTRQARRLARARRQARENLLKRIHQAAGGAPVSASEGGKGAGAPSLLVAELAAAQRQSAWSVRPHLKALARQGMIDLQGDVVRLTWKGAARARELERNYRLWELFLTHEVQLPLDHTERDAEEIEHILGPELVRELEEKYATTDPPAAAGGL